MWNKTAATAILGIDYPIVQGPFGGGLSSAKLVAAVSNAGGMGSFGAYHLQPHEIEGVNTSIKALTQKPYALNLWINDADEAAMHYTSQEYEALKQFFKHWFDALNIPLPAQPANFASKFEQQAEAILRIKPPACSFVFGVPPAAIIKEFKHQNIKIIGAATTPDEAFALEAAGVDLIVATGFEAGGHRPSFLRSARDSLTGTFALIPVLADNLHTPIIAAGGIADARGIVAALTLGASAVQIGTAFLACEESNAPPLHRQMLFSSQAKYTALTTTFTGRLARGITGTIAESTKDVTVPLAPFPLQTIFMNVLRDAAVAQGKPELLTFWAGQTAPLVKHTKATDLFNALVTGTEKILKSY